MNQHWGFGAQDFRYLSPGDVIENLCLSRGAGANYLLNVGPTGEGSIPYYETAVLRRVGEWTRIHESILYSGKPTQYKCQGRDFILRNDDGLYYFAFDLNIDGHDDVTAGGGTIGPRAIKGLEQSIQKVEWIDTGETLRYTQDGDLSAIDLTGYPYGSNLVVRIARLTVN
jgi:alpha-L-fucosidase